MSPSDTRPDRSIAALAGVALAFGIVFWFIPTPGEESSDVPGEAPPVTTDDPRVAGDPPPQEPLDPFPKTSRSDRPGLTAVTFAVVGAERRDAVLILEIAFENRSDEDWAIAGNLGARDLRLADASGSSPPLEIDPALERIDSGDGLAPGETATGEVSFPWPQGDPPYRLLLESFEPIEIDAGDVTVAPPPLEEALRSASG